MIEETERGFSIIKFTDTNRQECSLQKSSSVKSKIWLGVDNTGPDIPDINGKYDSDIGARMHLSREDVEKLIPMLQTFVETGDITTDE